MNMDFVEEHLNHRTSDDIIKDWPKYKKLGYFATELIKDESQKKLSRFIEELNWLGGVRMSEIAILENPENELKIRNYWKSLHNG